MSVIASDGKTIAADTQWTSMAMRTELGGATPKLYHIRGCALGCAGEARRIVQFIDWARAGAKPYNQPEWPDEDKKGIFFQALELTGDRQLFLWDATLVRVAIPAPYSIGSGAPFALAAMFCGKDPGEAVDLAKQLDTDCGGDTVTVTPGG